MKKSFSRNQHGLTILEVLIAVVIAASVVGASVIMVTRVSMSGTSSEARSQAVTFAQEAIDIVKNIRDNQYCSFFSIADDYYYIYPSGQTFILRSMGASLSWDNMYVDDSGNDWVALNTATERDRAHRETQMRRSIRIQPITGGKRINVEVQWLRSRGSTTFDSYTMVSEFYQWKN